MVLALIQLSILALAPAAVPAVGSVAWDEGVDGDLSTDPGAPTAIAFGLGTNSLRGSVASPDDTRDFITFTISPGQQLLSLRQVAYVDVPGGGPANRGFNALNAGSTSLAPNNMNGASFLGGDHIDPLPSGTDMLATLAGAPLSGTGFSVPLGPGTYCYLIQQTGLEENGYELEFVLGPTGAVPALPVSGLVVLALGMLGLGFWTLRRRRLPR